MSTLKIDRAELANLDDLVPLFDGYRQFYGRSSDLAGARSFLSARLDKQDSVIFLALAGNSAIGFCQLYPSFTSAGMARVFILNDLYVAPQARNCGVARSLLHAAAKFAAAAGAARLTLSTAHDNVPAQSLYEDCGWKRDVQFQVYHLPVS